MFSALINNLIRRDSNESSTVIAIYLTENRRDGDLCELHAQLMIKMLTDPTLSTVN
jgi:hypothetical protein